MRHILIMVWNGLYISNLDRTGFIIKFVTPFLLSTIIAFAFSGLGSSLPVIEAFPVALVNLDEGADSGGGPVNLGDTFVQVLLPAADAGPAAAPVCPAADAGAGSAPPVAITDLLTTTRLNDAEEARAGVRSGLYQAAIIIPPDFSRRLSPQVSATGATLAGTEIEIYASGASPLQGSIVRSLVQAISQQLVTGNVTIAATLQTLIDRAGSDPAFGLAFAAAGASGTFQPDFACAFVPALNTVTVAREPLDAVQQRSVFVQILTLFGAAQAAFFALFTAQFALLSLYDERKQGTLQRLLVVPMPAWYIVAAKLLTAFVNVVVQLTVLLLALTLVASLREGQVMFIWGDAPLLVLLTIMALALSVCGISALLVGLARTPEQARLFGSLINVGLGALGGSFGFVLPAAIAGVSPIYWGSEAFRQLAGGNTDIGLNLLVLLLQGGIMFVIGSWFFVRRSGIKGA